MTTYYDKPSSEQVAVLSDVMESYHRQRLGDVRVALLVAFGDDDDKPALKHRGLPALAVVRVVPLKMRAHGLDDAEIVIDGGQWRRLSGGERRAVMDHELTHLELKVDKTGRTKRDDLGRPKLTMRHHDYEFGWFSEVAERHGRASQEIKQAKKILQTDGQLYFDFGGAPS